MKNVSLVVIIEISLKAIANPAMQAMGWHPEGGDSFYLTASANGAEPATHAYLRTQGEPQVGDFLRAVAAGNWPEAPPEFITAGARVSTWDELGLAEQYRAALSAGISIDVKTEAELAALGIDYAGHAARMLAAQGLVRVQADDNT